MSTASLTCDWSIKMRRRNDILVIFDASWQASGFNIEKMTPQKIRTVRSCHEYVFEQFSFCFMQIFSGCKIATQKGPKRERKYL